MPRFARTTTLALSVGIVFSPAGCKHAAPSVSHDTGMLQPTDTPIAPGSNTALLPHAPGLQLQDQMRGITATAPGELPPLHGTTPIWYGTRTEALEAKHVKDPGVSDAGTHSDLDGDETPDEIFPGEQSCIVVRKSSAGFTVDVLPFNAVDSPRCSHTVITAARRVFPIAFAGGERGDAPDFTDSSTWIDYAFFAFRTNLDAVPLGHGHLVLASTVAQDIDFAAGADGSVVMTMNEHGTPAEKLELPMLWNDSHTSIMGIGGCWTPPGGKQTLVTTNCKAVPTREMHLRRTESSAETGMVIEVGTSLTVLSQGTAHDGTRQAWCVTTTDMQDDPTTSDMGWLFLDPSELKGCTARSRDRHSEKWAREQIGEKKIRLAEPVIFRHTH